MEIELLGGTVKATVTHVEKLPGRGERKSARLETHFACTK